MDLTERMIWEWSDKQIRQKMVWLETFGVRGPKPRADSHQKEDDIFRLEAIRYDYGMACNEKPDKPRKTIRAQDLADWCSDQIRIRKRWLEAHGPKSRDRRPEMEIDTKENDLDILYAVRRDYEDAIRARNTARKNPA